MAYFVKDATTTLFNYMGIEQDSVRFIEETNSRGFVYQTPNGENVVIFLYPISHKADDTKNFFDTRDSGVKERGIAWNYAITNNMKYFCLAVNDQVEKYKDYIFSLECNESRIAEVAGTVNGTRNGSGTQVVIPNDCVGHQDFERILTRNNFYIAVIHKSVINDYLEKYDNRPYMAIGNLIDIDSYSDADNEVTGNLPLRFATGFKSDFSRNRIIFGAPGTGKSFTINIEKSELLGEDNETDYERVTFHPDYSYANFVGTYKPVMVTNNKTATDADTDYVISILNDSGKSAQEKYDILFERFKDEGLTSLPLLLGLYTDEVFKSRKQDGSDAVGDNSVERNHGRAVRKYVSLLTGKEAINDIAYEYVPGSFMRVYVNALKNARSGNPKPYLLIIEEINRANVAAVFGDIFQLLDRDADGVSEYPIQASEDIKKYLAKELGGNPEDYSKLRIPDNMFIWATMNSADQGVFPMDTAFKRRWDFTYLGIDDSDEDVRGKYVVVGSKEKQRIEWNELRKAINEFLAENKINEDKQLGPYFIARNIVVPADGGTEIDSKKFCDVFKHKVIMYLFDDAAKQKRPSLFEGSAKGQNRYSKICAAFDEQGIGIFNRDIQGRIKVQDLVFNEHELDENGIVKNEAESDTDE